MMTYFTTFEQTLELVKHLAESVETNRFFFRDIGLILNLVENSQQNFVDETSESRIESSRSHDRLGRQFS